MIPDENLALLEAARAIAAGRPVDWVAIESSGAASESLAALLDELKVVANIADLHRSLPDPSVSSERSLDDSLPSIAARTAEATPGAAGTWGPLRLLARVGEGAFGDVYRAWDPRLDREVALKLLKRRDPRVDVLGSAVIDEGRMLARVRHPNVVTVYGADRIDGRVGLWMEFVHGRTIEVILKDHGPFGAQEAALLGLDVCRALSAVHRAGLVHRDVKAQNVMREAGGRIVLMDFGTGRESLSDAPAQLAGTPLYLAPEVLRGDPATARGDIYSVGVLLYHLVTGAYPIKGRTVGDLREAHAQGKRSWLRDDRPDLPDTFVQAVERALEADPGQRYESAGAMEATLARVMSGADAVDAAPPAPGHLEREASPGRHRARGTARRQPSRSISLLLASLAASALVAAVVAPTSWRDRLLGGRGGSRPAQRAAGGAAVDASTVVRRVSLPNFLLVGAPSFDGTLFSIVDPDGNAAIVDLATGQPRRLTSDGVINEKSEQFAEFVSISPDNQFIAYTWYALDGKYELRVVDVQGKRPRVLVRSDFLSYPVPIEWARDGQSILTTLERTDRSVQIALVSAADGTVHSVKEMGPISPMHASLSPDGQFIVYDAPQHPSAYPRDVFIIRSDGSNERRLIENPANDANPVWAPDGQRVLFTSDRSGTMDVWAVSVDRGLPQGEPRLIHGNIGRLMVRGLTDTGSYFYNADVASVDVYQADLTRDGVRNVATVSPSYTGLNISSEYSQDGRRLAYTSRRGAIGFDRGSTTLAIRDLQTKEQREFVPALKGGFLLRGWSPDGRYLLVGGEDLAGRKGAFAIDTGDGRVQVINSGEGGPRPHWLPDGRVLYFKPSTGALIARTVEIGAEDIVENLDAEGFSIRAGLQGRGFKISPDGQTLALTSATRGSEGWTRRLVVKPLGAGGTVRELVRATEPDLIMFQDWTPDGADVLFTRWIANTPGAEYALWRVSIHGGDPQPLGLSMPSVRDVSVHPDGTRITFTSGYPKHELWVMENFLGDK